jgi:hypothetical protein
MSKFIKTPQIRTLIINGDRVDVPIYDGITVGEHANYIEDHARKTKLYHVAVASLAYKINQTTGLDYDEAESIIRNPADSSCRQLLAPHVDEWARIIELESLLSNDNLLALMMIRRVESDFDYADMPMVSLEIRQALLEIAYQEISKAFPASEKEKDPKKD